jgi:ribosome-binding protein aMBF1 (putative translation factor)
MLENGMPVEFTITGNVPVFYIDLTRRLFAEVKEAKPEDDGEELIEITKSEWFKKTEAETAPGDVLRSLRTMRGMRQAALAKKIGVQPRQVSDMENGRAPIGKKMARKIGDALNMNWKHFL